MKSLLLITLSMLSCSTGGLASDDGMNRGDERRALARELASAGINNPQVLRQIEGVPRHEFVPPNLRDLAYIDEALPIGEGQTISQPYVVAYMTEALRLQPTDRVLEIGTGSGYQAAILAGVVREVFTIEIVGELGKRAEQTLQRLGYRNIRCRIGDGYGGWPEEAPFDAIILIAAPQTVPQPLIDQLKDGGRLIAPEGAGLQRLVLLTKERETVRRESLLPVAFVPMTGEAARRSSFRR